jgi:competence protein ComEA
MKFRATKTVSKALAASVLFGVLALPTFAATLVNINTADSATLQTLNGIGPSKAQAIIDYRTQNGPFAKIEDIQNVSGIGPSTYANIKDYITVEGSTAQTGTAQSQQTTTQTQPQTTSQTNAGALPPEVTAKITTNAQALAGAGTVFDGTAYNSAGEPLVSNVRYMWNFGDGSVAEGQHVLHTYHYPGTYSVELGVAYNFSSASTRLSLSVVVPSISLVAEGDSSLTVYNESKSDIDIGLWVLVDGAAKPFVIPTGTVVLAGEGVRFGAAATGLPGSRSAVLLYPNGTQAASAVVGARSPLRGERVTSAPVARVTVSAPTQPVAVATNTQNLAAVAVASTQDSNTPWLPVGGLVGLLAVGSAGAWYMGRPGSKTVQETKDPSEEFDIEE